MAWILSNWRLKVLSVVLALGLLAAVAFSQNPVKVQTVNAKVDYVNLQHDGIVLINPPKTVPVDIVGLADNLRSAVVIARVDGARLSHSARTPPTTVGMNVKPSVTAPGVTVRVDSVAVQLTVDTMVTNTLDVEVKTPNVAPGTQVQKAVAIANGTPAKVRVTAPASLIEDVKAYVSVDTVINGTGLDSPGQPVKFLNGAKADWKIPETLPTSSYDPDTVTAHIEALRPNGTNQVTLRENPTGNPATCYVIQEVVISPDYRVVLSGPADVVGALDHIDLPPVDVTGATGDKSAAFDVPVPRDQRVTAQPAKVTVRVGIKGIQSCLNPPTPAPTPTPTPSNSPAPTPTPTPRPT